MGIGLLNYVAAGAGQAMGHVADAAYAHWTDKDLQDQKDQAEAKKEKRIEEARITSRNEQAAYERSPQFKEDTANTSREGAINKTKVDIETNRMLMQEKTSPGTVELENKIKTDEAVGTTKAGLISKDLINQHEQNPDIIKAQKDAELLAGTMEGKNKAELERQRALTPEGIKASAAATLAGLKTQAEIYKENTQSAKNLSDADRQKVEATRSLLKIGIDRLEASTKHVEALQKVVDGTMDEDAKVDARIALQDAIATHKTTAQEVQAESDQLLGVKRESAAVSTMPNAETETSAAPGGGSVPTAVAALEAKKPTGALNTEEKPKEPTPLKVDGMSQTQIMNLLSNSKNLSQEQQAYVKKNSVFARFLTDDPKMVGDIYEAAGLNYERTASEQEHYNAVEGQYLKGLSTEKKNAFSRLTVQQKHKAVREAGYST
jgi:hypothetical protein